MTLADRLKEQGKVDLLRASVANPTTYQKWITKNLASLIRKEPLLFRAYECVSLDDLAKAQGVPREHHNLLCAAQKELGILSLPFFDGLRLRYGFPIQVMGLEIRTGHFLYRQKPFPVDSVDTFVERVESSHNGKPSVITIKGIYSQAFSNKENRYGGKSTFSNPRATTHFPTHF